MVLVVYFDDNITKIDVLSYGVYTEDQLYLRKDALLRSLFRDFVISEERNKGWGGGNEASLTKTNYRGKKFLHVAFLLPKNWILASKSN